MYSVDVCGTGEGVGARGSDAGGGPPLQSGQRGGVLAAGEVRLLVGLRSGRTRRYRKY